MTPNAHIQFVDKCVSYETFMTDLSARLVRMLKSDAADPEFVSQRRAFEIFGRRNVERWRKHDKIRPCKRPGRLEYRTAELRLLQRVEQDYFDG